MSLESPAPREPGIQMTGALSLMKYLGLSYPTHFLKIAGSGISDNCFEHSLKQANILARRIVT